MPGRPGRNSTDAFEACQAQPQPIPECLCHRHRGERRGHRTSEKTIIFAPPSLQKRSHFSVPGEARGGRQTGRGFCWVCVLLSDVLRNDTSRLISYTLMHHIPEKQEGTEELSTLFEKAVCVCVCHRPLRVSTKRLLLVYVCVDKPTRNYGMRGSWDTAHKSRRRGRNDR